MDLLLAFVIAMVITMALIPPLANAAGRLHVLDDPSARKVHTHPIPRVGGVAMAFGALLPLGFWLPMDRVLIGYLAAMAVLVIFGAWDDRVTLRAHTKFAGQILAVLIVMLVGHVSIDTLMIRESYTLPHWLGFGLTFLFLLGITNAINLSDGLDGLAGGTTLLCCAALALLAGSWQVQFVETLAVVLMGALLGFLRFNTYPARIFMGDAGSQFLGLSLGVLCILLSKNAITPLSTTLPLLLVGLPLVDTLMVMTLRIREGRSPFHADRRHFHHRLLAMGFDHHEAVIVIYSVQCALLLLAWQLRYESDVLIILVALGFAVLFAGTLVLVERSGWRWRVATPTHRSPIARLRSWLAARERLPRWSIRLTCASALVYMLGVALLASPAQTDIGWLGVLGVVILALGLAGNRIPTIGGWLIRGAAFVGAIIAVYLDQVSTERSADLQALKWCALPPLTAAVAISMRLSGARRFEATPLDLLLIFAAIALPNLPGLAGTASNFGFSAAKLVLLCYAIEMIATLKSPLRNAFVAGSMAFYLLIALRALI